MTYNPKILIIGAGAIGGFYGAKLAQAGAQVTVVCRSDYDHVKTNGFKIKSHWEKEAFHFMPERTLRDVKEYNDEADFVIIATKVLPNISTIDLTKPALSKNTSIVLLQNGIHIEHDVAKAFPDHHIISILAFVCVSKIALGTIHHQDYGRLVIGDFPHGITAKTQSLVDLWLQSGVPCQKAENVQMERWKKLVWNAPFNPISVIKQANTKEILDDAQSRQLVKDVMQEVFLLAKADGYELPQHIAEKNIDMTLDMKPYKTSMLLDYEANRPMEVEAILGNAITFANKQSIHVPNIKNLYHSLNTMI